MSNPRTIMIVAGGAWQVPLIRKAKELGLKVVNTNLHHDSPGFAWADLTFVADVLDRERNLEIARETKPHAIVTDQTDIAVPTVAYLCEELGLPGIGVVNAELFTNKLRMRDFRSHHGFANPPYRPCRSLEDLDAFFAGAEGAPIVVKPPDSQSSRGVTKVETGHQLVAAFAEARNFSRNGSILAEGFIDGTEITVEGLKLPGKHLTLAVSTKEHYAHNSMVAERLLYARDFPEFDMAKLTAAHDRFIAATGLPFGITHSEYRVHHGEFYLVEAAARGGGTKVSSHVIPLMSGIDANEILLRMALGEEPEVDAPRVDDRFTVLQFFDFDPGKVAAVHGLDLVREWPGVVDIGLSFQPGDLLEPSLDDRSRHMHLIAWSDSLSSLEDLVSRVRQSIRIDYA